MKTLRMVVDFEYDDELTHGDDREAEAWLLDSLRQADNHEVALLLYSHEIGDTIGAINLTVVDILGEMP